MSELPPEALAPEPGPLPRGPGRCPTRCSRPPTGTSASSWRMLGIAGRRRAAASLVFQQLNPALLLRDTTANGGDMGAHVWFPAYLRDHLLPLVAGRRLVAGLVRRIPGRPVLLPVAGAARGAALDVVLPYNVAFKLVTALGPVLLPASAYFLGRGLKVRRPGPELFAVAHDAVPVLQGGRRRAPAATTRRSSSTSGSWAGRSSARWRGSTRSRWRSRSGVACLGALAFSLRDAAAPLAPGGAARGHGALPHRGRHLRRRRCARRLAVPPTRAHVHGGRRDRRGRRAAHRVLDGAAARHVRVHGEHALREAHLVPRLPVPGRALVGRRVRGDRRGDRARSGATAPS